jgi:hypothetical protein
MGRPGRVSHPGSRVNRLGEGRDGSPTRDSGYQAHMTRPAIALGFVLVLAFVLAGSATEDRERDAAAVAERFHAALERGDGGAACRELSDEAASTVERQEERPCEAAILRLELPEGGTPTRTEVYLRSASVDLVQGGTTFLGEGSLGWKVSASGCHPAEPDQPYECDLEG